MEHANKINGYKVCSNKTFEFSSIKQHEMYFTYWTHINIHHCNTTHSNDSFFTAINPQRFRRFCVILYTLFCCCTNGKFLFIFGTIADLTLYMEWIFLKKVEKKIFFFFCCKFHSITLNYGFQSNQDQVHKSFLFGIWKFQFRKYSISRFYLVRRICCWRLNDKLFHASIVVDLISVYLSVTHSSYFGFWSIFSW